MRPITRTFSMAAGDVDGVCAAQIINTTGTINGALATGGVATFAVARHIDITGTATVTSVNFTITGTDRYGNAITEVIVGPVGTATVKGVKNFKTVTAVSTDGTTTANVTVGEADEAEDAWIPLDHYQEHFDVSVTGNMTAAGGATWGIERTLSDVQAVGFQENDANVQDVIDTNLLAQATADSGGSVTAVCEAIRAKMTAHTAEGVIIVVQQSGY